MAEERRGGLPLGRIGGVPIELAPSWILVAVLVTILFAPAVAERLPELGAATYLVAFAFAVLLYGSILIHELGHSLVARGFGLRVRRITLHALGGVSEIIDEAPTAGREFAIAVAGPTLSLLLGGAGALILAVADVGPLVEVLLLQLTIANLLVGVFNLLPGLPLDGGRILRAAVWGATGRQRTGTRAAAAIGRVVAIGVLLLPFGLAAWEQRSPSLVAIIWSALIALFIWQGAGAAVQADRIRARLPDLTAGRLARRAVAVTPSTPLAETLRRLSVAQAGAIVIVDGAGRPLGIVPESAVSAVPAQRRPWLATGDLARRVTATGMVASTLAGEELLEALNDAPAGEYLVANPDGTVYGVLTAADVEAALGLSGRR
jgi:Zn-dependent protease